MKRASARLLGSQVRDPIFNEKETKNEMIVVIFRDRVAIELSLKKLMRCKDMPRFRMTIPLDTRQVKQRE